jgi:hypothetical protein
MADDAFASASKTFSSPIRLRVLEQAPPPPPPPPAATASAPAAASSAEAAAGAPAAAPSPSPAAAAAAQPSSASPAPLRPRVDRALVKQAALGQTQALRAIVHRAAAEMEAWSLTVGASQRTELTLYWQTWAEHIARGVAVNARALSYLRAVAASTAQYAASVTAARQFLEPIASGAYLDGHAPSLAGKAGKVEDASKGAAGRHAPRLLGTLTLPALASNMLEMHGQVAGVVGDLASNLSREQIGDAGAEGSSGGAPKVAKKEAAAKSKRGGACPIELGPMVEYYTREAAEVSRAGTTLSAALTEASTLAAVAFEEFDLITAGYLTGAGTFTTAKSAGAARPPDMWLAELHYRRACRALLAIKAIYLTAMAQLFERYREVEAGRGDAIARACDEHASAVSKLFERVPGKSVSEAAHALNTHADFCRAVEVEARSRILEWRRATLASAMGSAGAMLGGPGASTASEAYASYEAGHGQGGGGSSAAHSAHLSSAHIHFSLDAAPAVLTPFASPLVVRVGILSRKVGTLMASWKTHVAVLTRDCNLHLFALEPEKGSPSATGISSGQTTAPLSLVLSSGSEDVATHPDVLQALFRLGQGGTAGIGGTGLEVAASAAVVGADSSAARAAQYDGESAEDVTDAAASRDPWPGRTPVKASGRSAKLPDPALSQELLAYASAYATRVSDLLPPTMGGTGLATAPAGLYAGATAVEYALGLLRSADSSPSFTVELTPTAKFSFAPQSGPFILEVSDTKSGWMGSSTSKVLLRASGSEDMLDWIVAGNACVDMLAIAAGGK